MTNQCSTEASNPNGGKCSPKQQQFEPSKEALHCGWIAWDPPWWMADNFACKITKKDRQQDCVLKMTKWKIVFDRDIHTISPGDYLKAFMDPTFLGYMKAYINLHIVNRNDDVSNSDIITFICIELMLSFYKVSTVLVVDDLCNYD